MNLSYIVVRSVVCLHFQVNLDERLADTAEGEVAQAEAWASAPELRGSGVKLKPQGRPFQVLFTLLRRHAQAVS